MKGIKNCVVDLETISPENDNCFFGYYDLNAFDSSGDRHLCCRTSFIDRIPTDKDVLELGSIKDGIFEKFAETTAWNFQQGAMLQYKSNTDDIVFYNVRESNKFKTVMHNLSNNKLTVSDRAAACISLMGGMVWVLISAEYLTSAKDMAIMA